MARPSIGPFFARAWPITTKIDSLAANSNHMSRNIEMLRNNLELARVAHAQTIKYIQCGDQASTREAIRAATAIGHLNDFDYDALTVQMRHGLLPAKAAADMLAIILEIRATIATVQCWGHVHHSGK